MPWRMQNLHASKKCKPARNQQKDRKQSQLVFTRITHTTFRHVTGRMTNVMYLIAETSFYEAEDDSVMSSAQNQRDEELQVCAGF